MDKTFEIIENDVIKTYKISYNDKKLKELKEKIKKYSIVRELEIRYDIMCDDAESYVKTSPYIDFDEYMGVVNEKNHEKKSIKEYDYDEYVIEPYYGGSHYVTNKVRLKHYPRLFHILFQKHKDNKDNIFKRILLYLNNDPSLVPSMDNNIKDIIQKFCGVEFPKLVYDENIPIQEKISLIEELFNSMIITFEREESLLEINSQINVVSKINVRYNSYKTKLIKAMEDRIKTARENKKVIDSINDYLIKNKSCDNSEETKILFL